jgi:hypothetical protein
MIFGKVKTTNSQGESMANQNRLRFLRGLLVLASAFVLLGVSVPTSPAQQSSSNAPDEPFLEEWVYKVKWGHNEEFFGILKKYQLAILEREKQLGYVTQYTVYAPGLHTSEDQRWDYRVFIVFKNQAAAQHEREVAHQLFPDQQTFKKDENHRWELTEAHWDLPLHVVDPSAGE